MISDELVETIAGAEAGYSGPKMRKIKEAFDLDQINPDQALVLRSFVACQKAMADGESFEGLLSKYKASYAKYKDHTS
jgi:hypothetical protein